jgi:hypothetical protein
VRPILRDQSDTAGSHRKSVRDGVHLPRILRQEGAVFREPSPPRTSP